jgi:hypothetical protein
LIRWCGSAEFFADFGSDEIEEEDEIEKALNKRWCEVHMREDPEVVAAEKKYCCKGHSPGPPKQHKESAAGGEEKDGKDKEELWIVTADSADYDDYGEQEQIKRDCDEAGKGKKVRLYRWRTFRA